VLVFSYYCHCYWIAFTPQLYDLCRYSRLSELVRLIKGRSRRA